MLSWCCFCLHWGSTWGSRKDPTDGQNVLWKYGTYFNSCSACSEKALRNTPINVNRGDQQEQVLRRQFEIQPHWMEVVHDSSRKDSSVDEELQSGDCLFNPPRTEYPVCHEKQKWGKRRSMVTNRTAQTCTEERCGWVGDDIVPHVFKL